MKNTIATACIPIAALVFNACCVDAAVKGLSLDYSGIRLVIPDQFLVKDRSPPSINLVRGLDSSAAGALVKFPTADLKRLLPKSALEPLSTPTLIQIYGPGESERAVRLVTEHVNNINARRGRYAEMTVVADEATGWYRIYDQFDRRSGTNSWEVVRQAPPLVPDDLVAECINFDKAVVTTCRLTTFNVDGIAVETSIREEHLIFYRRYMSYIAEVIRNWRVK